MVLIELKMCFQCTRHLILQLLSTPQLALKLKDIIPNEVDLKKL